MASPLGVDAAKSTHLAAMALDQNRKRSSRLTIVCQGSRAGYVLCRCTCGTEKEVRRDHIRTGSICSCGCLSDEVRAVSRKTHGRCKTAEYKTWKSIIRRCHNPKAQDYARYGGRGIQVCSRWRASFVNFFADMGQRPSPEHSIDRCDNYGNYEPGNCRWATRTEQGRNRRCNDVLELGGVRKTAVEWAQEMGLEASTIYARARRGWSDNQVLMEKPGRWSRLRCDSCLGCGSSARKHHAKGYCNACYGHLRKRVYAASGPAS
jgi:hypothetical protein